jgi:hypothetical protein
MRRVRTALASMCCLAALTACDDSSVSGSSGGSALSVALSRITATEDSRMSVTFDNTAALTELAGTAQGQRAGGYGDLRGYGAASLTIYGSTLADRPGITLTEAEFTVSAGLPPHMVGLVVGGQDAGKITGSLTDLGWREERGQLVAPGIGEIEDAQLGALTLQLAQVLADGSDLVYGGAEADLGYAVLPFVPKLADDPRIKALSSCLGDVVAATVAVPHMRGALHPTAVAVGVRTPAKNTDTPRAVACLSWKSGAEADRYQELLDKALRESVSGVTAKPWKDMLADVTIQNLGGDEHVVSWEAKTPNNPPNLVLKMLNSLDLPAFPCSDKMTPEMRAQFPGYC